MHRAPPVNHYYGWLVWQLEQPPNKLLKSLNLLLR